MLKFCHERFFFFGKLVWAFASCCRQISVKHFIFLLVDYACAFIEVYGFEKLSAFHLEFGMAVDDFGFFLELDYRDGFVHLCDESVCLLVMLAFLAQFSHSKKCAGVVFVCFHGKGGKRKQVDAITVFESGEVAIAQ